MCIIIYTLDKPDLDLLEECELMNPHGGGIAWRDKGKISFEKGIDSKQIKYIIDHTQPPYAIHFRISTVGGTPKELTHPFPVGGDLTLSGTTDQVLFHNGHWHSWEDRVFDTLEKHDLPPGIWSDSRAMAYLCQYYGINWLNLLDGQKILVFGGGDNELYCFGDWVKHDEKTWLSHELRPPLAINKGLYSQTKKFKKRKFRTYTAYDKYCNAKEATEDLEEEKEWEEQDLTNWLAENGEIDPNELAADNGIMYDVC